MDYKRGVIVIFCFYVCIYLNILFNIICINSTAPTTTKGSQVNLTKIQKIMLFTQLSRMKSPCDHNRKSSTHHPHIRKDQITVHKQLRGNSYNIDHICILTSHLRDVKRLLNQHIYQAISMELM